MFDIDHARFEEGRAAYARGDTLRNMLGVIGAIYRMSDTQQNWREGENASRSLVLGFSEALLADIRKIAGGVRGGTKA